jgi:hypothetical protein
VTLSPTNADSGRGDLFRSYLFSRAGAYTAVFGSVAVFAFGASRHNLLIMLAGPLVVVTLVLAVSAVVADRAAGERFYRHYARSLGLVYWPRAGLLPLTPLLGAGDRRWCEHWMTGTLPGEPRLTGGIGQYVWEEIEEGRDPNSIQLGRARSRHRMTLCVADLEASMATFKGLFLRPHRGLIPGAPDWRRSGTRAIELESVAFSRRYEVLVDNGQDENLARQLLSPSLVVWLAEHPLAPCFEIRAGMLVVFVSRPLEDEGSLTYLMDATRRIASRVASETAERRHTAVLARSTIGLRSS